jgi:hypothetical protein
VRSLLRPVPRRVGRVNIRAEIVWDEEPYAGFSCGVCGGDLQGSGHDARCADEDIETFQCVRCGGGGSIPADDGRASGFEGEVLLTFDELLLGVRDDERDIEEGLTGRASTVTLSLVLIFLYDNSSVMNTFPRLPAPQTAKEFSSDIAESMIV